MTGLAAVDQSALDHVLYDRADTIEGYFTLSEADLLIRAIQSAGPTPTYLEVGLFRGRSTMFALAALPTEGRLIAVDAFVYAEHSPAEVRGTLNDPRVRILEGTVAENWAALVPHRPDVVLIDADHSFAGVVLDLSLTLALTSPGALVATHDVSDRFPGVQAAVGALVHARVLAQVEAADDLVIWRVISRPGWLIDPRPEIDWDLPEGMNDPAPMLVQLANRRTCSPST